MLNSGEPLVASGRSRIVGLVFVASLITGWAVSVGAFSFLLALACFGLATVVLWVRPVFFIHGLLLLSLVLPTSQLTTEVLSVTLLGYHVLFSDILVAMLLVRWLLDVLTRHREAKGVVVGRSARQVVVLMLALACAGVIWGLVQDRELSVILYDARPIFYYPVLFVAMDFLGSEREVERVSKEFVLGLTAYSVFVLSYFVLQDAHPLSVVIGDSIATYGNRIGFVNENYMIIGVPMVVLLLMQRRILIHGWFILFASLALFLLIQIVSRGRANAILITLSIALSLFVEIVSSRKVRLLPTTVGRTIVIVFLVVATLLLATNVILPTLLGSDSVDVVANLVDRFLALGTDMGQEVHIAPRLNMLRSGLDVILQAPITGHGYGFWFPVEGWDVPLTFIDNSWVTLWIRLGLVGVVVLLWLVVICARSVSYALHHQGLLRNVYVRVLYVSLAGGGGVLLIHTLNNAWLVNSTGVLPMLIVAGAVVGFSDSHRVHARPEVNA